MRTAFAKFEPDRLRYPVRASMAKGGTAGKPHGRPPPCLHTDPRSALAYVSGRQRLKSAGHPVECEFLRVPRNRLALKRIAARVRQAGHPAPKVDGLHRFQRAGQNFDGVYP